MANKNYIKSFELDGYRTIRGTKGKFKNGLNIIIGKNGTGKTNLVDLFYNILRMNMSELANTQSKFTIYNEESESEDTVKTQSELEGHLPYSKVHTLNTSINDKTIQYLTSNLIDDYKLQISILRFSYDRLPILINSVNFNGNKGEFFSKFMVTNQLDSNLFSIISYNMISDNNYNSSLIQDELKDINDLLISITDIEEVRFSENFDFQIDGTEILLKNLQLEFLRNGKWLLFEQLSDGIKRIVLILLVTDKRRSYYNHLIFIEEPELGLHPHQLFKIMQYLKEASRNSQIIITTHSPMILDMLESDELDRIQIAELNEKGQTRLRPLTAEQITKAQYYIETVGDLSSYWLHSDLEDRD